MKTCLISSVIATVSAAALLCGAQVPVYPGGISRAPADPLQKPGGLSDSEWSGIRGAYERKGHAIVPNADGTRQARNPGQAWVTLFDARGFTVTPDAGGWEWGLELEGYAQVSQVRQDGGKIFYERGDGLTRVS